jgi:methylenetetrahydrofolate dehydrogenase (NAD+)
LPLLEPALATTEEDVMATPVVPATCKVILAGTIAKGLLAEVAEGLSKLNKKPKLVGFLANDDPAARMYADWSAKTCVEK